MADFETIPGDDSDEWREIEQGIGVTVIVCGSRTWTDQPHLWSTLDELYAAEPFDLLVHGGAKGADSLAHDWATANGVAVVECPANWERYGKAAGPIRNERMIRDYQPSLVVAFLGPGQSPGTRQMIDLARRKGIRTVVQT